MPCSDGRNDYDRWQDALDRNDELAQMLCGLCSRIEGAINHIKESPVPVPITEYELEALIENHSKLAAWWKDHKAADKQRREDEAAQREMEIKRYNAASKLTAKERRILGIRMPDYRPEPIEEEPLNKNAPMPGEKKDKGKKKKSKK